MTARAALHHFERPLQALAEIKRVCKSRGRIVIEDTLSSEVRATAELHNRIERIRDPSQIKMYSLSELTAFAQQLGLRAVGSELMWSDRVFEEWMDLVQPTPEVRAITRKLPLESMKADEADLNVRIEEGKLRFTYRRIMLLLTKP